VALEINRLLTTTQPPIALHNVSVNLNSTDQGTEVYKLDDSSQGKTMFKTNCLGDLPFYLRAKEDISFNIIYLISVQRFSDSLVVPAPFPCKCFSATIAVRALYSQRAL